MDDSNTFAAPAADPWTYGEITLWRPQREALGGNAKWPGVRAEFAAGRKSTLIVMATGVGKTACIGALAADEIKAGGRVLVLAHRDELIAQARGEIVKMGMDPAIEKAESRIEHFAGLLSDGAEAGVVIASVQTLKGKRLDRLATDYFTLIIVDESHHHIPGSGYDAICKRFAAARVVGVTATADRADDENLGASYESIAYEYPLPVAVADGRLCRVKVVNIETDIDLKGVRTTAGDLNAGDLEELIVPRIEELANKVRDQIGDRRTLVFTPDVGSAYLFADAMKKLGVSSEGVSGGYPICPRPSCSLVVPTGGHSCPKCGLAVKERHCGDCFAAWPAGVYMDDTAATVACSGCGGTNWRRGWKSRAVPDDERASKIKRFRAGEFQLLANCALLLEGFNCPPIAAVVLLRPSKSRPLVAQQIGRGTRLSPGKADLLIVDFSVLTGKHDLVKPAHLLAPDGTDEEVIADVDARIASGEQVDLLAEMEAAEKRRLERLEQLKRAKEQAANRRDKHQRDVQVSRRSLLYGRVEYDPLSIGAETIGANVESLMAIKGVPATEKQIATLEKLGVRAASSLSKTAAGQLMNKLVSRIAANLASLKQIAFLETLHRRAGVPYDKERMRTLKFDEASVMIGDLKKKLGWT